MGSETHLIISEHKVLTINLPQGDSYGTTHIVVINSKTMLVVRSYVLSI